MEYISEQTLKAIERSFWGILGSEILKRDVKIVQGCIIPERKYTEGYYNWQGNNMFADAIIEYPDGTLRTLMKEILKY